MIAFVIAFYVLGVAITLELILEEPKNQIYAPACIVVSLWWPLLGVLGLCILIMRLFGVKVNPNV